MRRPRGDAGRIPRIPRIFPTGGIPRLVTRSVAVVLLVLAVAACPSPGTGEPASETIDQRDDSALRRAREAAGESGLPGARGITGALDASDDAAARAARLDSVLEGSE